MYGDTYTAGMTDWGGTTCNHGYSYGCPYCFSFYNCPQVWAQCSCPNMLYVPPGQHHHYTCPVHGPGIIWGARLNWSDPHGFYR